MPEPSLYPNAIDGYAQLPLAVDGVTPVNAFSINTLRSAILNIETELGITPSGTYDDVSLRLDALQAGVDAGGDVSEIEARLDLIEQDIADLQSGGALPALTNNQYAILMEDPGGTLTFQRLKQSMIEADFAISSFTAAASSLIEVGNSLVNPSFTASYTISPTSASVIDNDGNTSLDVISTPTSFIYPFSYTKNSYGSSVVFTLSASDGVLSDNDTETTTWTQKIFWGVDVAGGTSEAFIESLSNNQLRTSRNKSFTVTAGASDKIYYAYRSGYGDANFNVGGFDGGFTKVSDTISVTNSFGFTENYTLYESDNLGLGTTTVVVT